MSHQVLARKWRPQTFADMAGQQHVLQALGNALDQQRLHHAYLLTGTRGVGKTTIARILARCLNCDRGISRNPCGECGSCLEISEGRSIDLIEVDAASKTKVEDTREMLENVQFAPTAARYKVYLIDEVHMLSGHSFNALLKTLEEPPPHVIFVLATTHPQKIPATVLSRCLQFHLKNLAEPIIVERLQHIVAAEGLAAEEPALLMLARAASGSMRDALTLLEQASAFGNGQILAAQVGDMLGVIDGEVLVGLCDAIVQGDAGAALSIVDQYLDRATDIVALVDEMLALFHRAAVEQAVPDAGAEAQLHATAIKRYARALAPEELQLFYQALLIGKRDMTLAPDLRSGLEMLVLRLLTFQQLPAGFAVSPDSSGSAVQAQAPASTASADAATSAGKKNAVVENSSAGEKRGAAVKKKPVTADAPTPLEATPEPQPVDSRANFTAQQLDGPRWCEMFGALPLSGMVRAIAENMLPIDSAGDGVAFAMRRDDALLYKPEHSERIADALSIYFGDRITVEVRLVDDWVAAGLPAEGLETPAAWRARLVAERQQNAVESMRDDAGAQALIEAFDASIEIDSVEPLAAADGEAGKTRAATQE